MAQRIISTPSIKHGKAASIAAGFLKLLPPFMIVLPGMAARFMFDKCIESNSSPFPDWCETRLNVTVETNKAYPYLIIKTLPTGVVGLILASMALSMMSALSGVFNSTSTVLTFDIYKRYINPTVSDASAVRIGRLSTLLLTFISLAWLALIRLQNNAIYLIIQNIQTHVAPPLATVSLLAMIFPWVNEKGALVGILGGTGLGLIQYIAGMMARPQCIAEGNVTSFSCIGYFHFAGIVAVIVGMVTVGVSLWSDEKWRWRRKTVNNVNNDPETPPYDRIITTDNLDGAHQESDNNNNNNNEIADNMSNEPSTSPLHTLNRRSSQYPRSSNDMETGNTATASSAANDCDDTRPLVHYEESMDRSETSIELSVPMWFLHTAALVLALSSASLIIYFR